MKNKWIIHLYEFFIRYGTAAGMIFVLMLLGLLAGWSLYNGSGAAYAQQAPESFNTKTVPFFLACATPVEMRDVLLEVHGEVAMVAGWLDTGNQWLVYTNQNGTSMSFVVHKTDGEACLIWSGFSEEGRAFIPNPNPIFPDKSETNSEGWNQ